MADLTNRTDTRLGVAATTNWGAIWMGLFAFISIWTTFGVLGEAIFTSAANPNAPAPVAGMNWGESAWIIVLTVIAMYVAGRVTTHFAHVADRTSRIMYGLATFGLSVISFLLVALVAGAVMAGGASISGNPHSAGLLNDLAAVGWAGFVALFLGWIAAMAGAAQGSFETASSTSDMRPGEVQDYRRAA